MTEIRYTAYVCRCGNKITIKKPTALHGEILKKAGWGFSKDGHTHICKKCLDKSIQEASNRPQSLIDIFKIRMGNKAGYYFIEDFKNDLGSEYHLII